MLTSEASFNLKYFFAHIFKGEGKKTEVRKKIYYPPQRPWENENAFLKSGMQNVI